MPRALLLPLGLALLVVEARPRDDDGQDGPVRGSDRDRTRDQPVSASPPAACGDPASGRSSARLRPSRSTPPRSSFPAETTFAGYITLDDTSTWFALTDRVMDHGRTVSGLAPSTYQQVLADYLPGGYPIGAFMPLGLGEKLTGPGRRLALPADDRVLRRDARPRDLHGVRATRLVARAPCARGDPRRASCAPLLVLALERHQGGRRRLADRARLRLGRGDLSTAGRPSGRRCPVRSPSPPCSRSSARWEGSGSCCPAIIVLAVLVASRASSFGPDRGRPRRRDRAAVHPVDRHRHARSSTA